MIPSESDTVIAAERETETRVLVGCGAKKQAGRAPARDLYTSNYFQKKREYAEAIGNSWTVLSALHGSLAPSSLVEPYDVTMADYPLSADEHPDAEFRTTEEWATSVIQGLENCVHNLKRWDDRQPLGRVEVLAGQAYVAPLRDQLDALACEHGFEVVYPFDDTAGIGEQIGWLAERIEGYNERSEAADEQSVPRVRSTSDGRASQHTRKRADDRGKQPTLDRFSADVGTDTKEGR